MYSVSRGEILVNNNAIDSYIIEDNFICRSYALSGDCEEYREEIVFGVTMNMGSKLEQKIITSQSQDKDGYNLFFVPEGQNNRNFCAPVILSAKKPFRESKNSFKSIRFLGGALDIVQRVGYVTPNKATIIETSEKNIETFYTVHLLDEGKSYSVNILGKEAKVKVGAQCNQSSKDFFTLTAFSTLTIEFEDEQPIESCESITIYLNSVKEFLSFCIGQQNIDFNKIQLCDVNSKGNIAELRYNSFFTEHCNKKYSDDTIIKLHKLGSKLPRIIELFFEDSKKPYIEFLPSRNDNIHKIYGHNIINLVTSINREVIIHNREKNDTDRKGNEKCARELYKKYASSVMKTLKHFPELICTEDKINRDEIFCFINIRNTIEHEGVVSLSGASKAYYVFLCTVYYSVFQRAGFSLSEIEEILKDWNNIQL